MGTEALWVPLAIGAASAGAGYINSQRTARRQDEALAQQIRDQVAARQAAAQRVAQTVQETAASAPEQDRAGALQGYLDALRAHRAAASGAMATPGGTSAAFQQDARDAAGGVQDYGDRVADLMARIDAPALQRQREGFAIGNLGVDLARLRSKAQGMDFLNELRLRGIRRNPWLDLATQTGQSAAWTMARRGNGGA